MALQLWPQDSNSCRCSVLPLLTLTLTMTTRVSSLLWYWKGFNQQSLFPLFWQAVQDAGSFFSYGETSCHSGNVNFHGGEINCCGLEIFACSKKSNNHKIIHFYIGIITCFYQNIQYVQKFTTQ